VAVGAPVLTSLRRLPHDGRVTLPSKSLMVAILAALLGLSGLGVARRGWAAAPVEPGEAGRERRLLDTYRSVLADDPTQEYAFRRLLEVAHAVGGLSGLIKLYQEQVAAEPKNFGAQAQNLMTNKK
jgi:hypothetical protein